MGVVRNILIRGGADFSEMSREFKKAQRQMNSFRKNTNYTMRKITGALGIYGGFRFFKDAIAESNKAESSFLGLESIMTAQGKSIKTAQGFIEDYVKDGLVELTDATTAYKNLASRGYNHEQAVKSMIALKDAAAFGREEHLGLSEAVRTATAGLKAERSTLVDNVGVVETVGKMWETYADKVGKTTKSLTQQEKILAEVEGLMRATKFQTGDASKVAQTFEGRIAGLTQKMKMFKIEMGNGLKPIINSLLPLLDSLLQKMINLARVFKVVTETLFGKPMMDPNLTKKNSEGVEELGDNMEKAGKKAKRSVAGFDEFNSITKEDSSEGSLDEMVSESVDIIGNLEPLTQESNAIEMEAPKMQKLIEGLERVRQIWVDYYNDEDSAFFEFKERMKELWQGMNDYFEENDLSLLEIMSTLAIMLAEVMFNILNFMLEHKEGLKIILGLILGVWLAFKTSQVFATLKGFFGPFIPILGNMISGLWGIFTASGVASAGLGLLSGALALLKTFFAFLISPIGLVIMAIAALIGATIFLWNTNEKFREAMTKIWIKIKDVFLWIWEEVIQPIFGGIADTFSYTVERFKNLWENIKTIGGFIGEFFRKLFTGDFRGIFEDFTNLFTNVFTKMKDTFFLMIRPILERWNKVNDFFGGSWHVNIDDDKERSKTKNRLSKEKIKEEREEKKRLKREKQEARKEQRLEDERQRKLDAIEREEERKLKKGNSFFSKDKKFDIKNPSLESNSEIPTMSVFEQYMKSNSYDNNEDLLNGMSEIFAQSDIPSGTTGNSTIILEVDGKEMARALVNPLEKEKVRLGTKVVTVG